MSIGDKKENIIKLSVNKDFIPYYQPGGPKEESMFNMQFINPNFTNNPKKSLMAIVSKDCPYCNEFVPVLHQLASLLKGTNIPIGILDITPNTQNQINNNSILTKFLDVRAIPAIKIYDHGHFIDYSQGNRDTKSLLEFLININKIGK